MAKRRPNGDGMIRKRADGRWEGAIVIGRQCRPYKGFRRFEGRIR